jgi:hypothetical protein
VTYSDVMFAVSARGFRIDQISSSVVIPNDSIALRIMSVGKCQPKRYIFRVIVFLSILAPLFCGNIYFAKRLSQTDSSKATGQNIR